MYNNDGSDRRYLEVQLANYKLILEVNSDLLVNNQPLRDQIRNCMGMLESCLGEMDKGEGNNPTKYNNSLSEANKALEEIKALIKRMLNQDTSPHIRLQNPAESLGSL